MSGGADIFASALALSLIVLAFALLTRKQLRFLIHPPIEIEGKVIDVQVASDGSEEDRLHYRCTIAYAVDGLTHKIAIGRDHRPFPEERVPLVYPKGYPRLAIEGSRRGIKGYLARSGAFLLLFLAIILFGH
jgi:hypothetical protein